jgi:serine/threonine protein kinase
MALSAGRRLGPYEILEPLGAGGMGEVYRARDPRLEREVAIKVLPEELCRDPERLRRFETEALAAATLNHPNILDVHDTGAEEGVPYIVSELLEGETLRERLRSAALPPRKAINYAVQIAQGLAAAHEKEILHRDLKPENLFLTKDGRVKILDFGLAKLRDPQLPAGSLLSQQETVPWTSPGVVLGTVGYMSPEQVRGDPVDARADVFSFGAVLYEMLSGQRAFRGETPVQTMNAILSEDPPTLSSVNPALPPVLERIVHRCLEKQPEDRFHSAHDIGIALQTISGSTERVFTPEIRARSTWRQAAPWAATALVVVVAAVAVAVLWPRPPTAVVMRFSITVPHWEG